MPAPISLELANRMLPLVRRIVADIRASYRAWQQAVERFEIASASNRVDAEVMAAQRQAQDLAVEIQGYLHELSELGVEFKGFELGLVDFPGEIDGQQILWCWREGEPDVRYWHDPTSGYEGRQPVEALLAPSRHDATQT